MQMDLKLNISQKQKLIVTQTVQQSINILQMSAYDLREYIDKEFEENPVLDGEFEFVESEKKYQDKIDYKEMIKYLQFDSYSNTSNFEYNHEEEVSIFNFIAEKKTLKDYLYEQLLEVKTNLKEIEIVQYMIESLNSRGYLEDTIESIASELLVDEKRVQAALDILQSLEPCGIGARNLKECLMIQLKRKTLLDKTLENIVLNYLEYIADNKYSYIAKKINITARKVQEYGDIIKTLEPKPSSGYYTGDEIRFIIPDAYIVKFDNEYNVIMNNGVIPRLRINNLYKNTILNDKNEEEVEYVKEKINNAISLIKGIEQRNSTLLKLLECIVKRQKEYFEKGKKFLKPLTLKDVAIEINVHESTVSRTIKDKYILTDRGTVKIKDLFCNGIISCRVNGEDVSTNVIKNKIQQLIEEENKNKPLSDQIICDLLNDDEIDISRRTVAKYREELGIKSSAKRKRI